MFQRLALALELECAKVDIGTFNGRIGSMSYMILNEELKLIKDSDNNHDKYAIKIEVKNSYILGYIPVFFSKAVFVVIK